MSLKVVPMNTAQKQALPATINEPTRAQFIAKLANVQANAKAAKGQQNQFGNYSYRNCEDIMEGLKPHLDGLAVVINDEIMETGGRVYIKSTVTVTDGIHEMSNSAYAREADNKKGMDVAQVTGATSSYARKYALCGMFLIDNNRDPDSMDNRQGQQNQRNNNQRPPARGHNNQQPQQFNQQTGEVYGQQPQPAPQPAHNNFQAAHDFQAPAQQPVRQQSYTPDIARPTRRMEDGPVVDVHDQKLEFLREKRQEQLKRTGPVQEREIRQGPRVSAVDRAAQPEHIQRVQQDMDEHLADKRAQENANKILSPAQMKQLREAMEIAGIMPGEFCAKARLDSVSELTQGRFPKSLIWLRRLAGNNNLTVAH